MRIRDLNVKLSRVIIICLIVSLITGAIVYAQTATQPFTINRGVYPGAPSFTVWEEDGTYFAKNSYGVIAYSGTNAAIVIQASITAGTSIYITVGTYDLAGTSLLLKRNVFIEGESMTQTILTSSATIFSSPGNTSYAFWGIRLSNMNLNGTEAESSFGVDFDYTFSDVYLDHLKIEYFEYGISLDNCYGVPITNCEVNYNTYCGIFGADSHGLRVTDGKIYGNDNGIILNNCVNSKIAGQDIESNTSNGIQVKNSGAFYTTSAVLDGNYFEDNVKDIADKGTNTKICNNYFVNTASIVRAITVERIGAVITGNYIGNYTSQAIWIVSGATNCLLEGNMIVDTDFLLDDGADTKYFNNQNATAWLPDSS